MNSSKNETYFSLEFWFEVCGFPKSAETLSIYAVTPLSLISLVLNLLSYKVLSKKCFLGSLFFRYMKCYILNGAVLSLVCSTIFISTTPRLFGFTNTYGALAYTLYFFTPVQPLLFLYSCFLELCIIIERLLYFLPKRFRKIQNIDFKKLNLAMLLFCIILHVPTFFFFLPSYLDVQLDTNTTHRIWYGEINTFSYSSTGKVLTYLQYLIRDVLPLTIKIILNSLLIYLVKAYVKKLKSEKLANAQKVFNVRNDFVNLNVQNENYISKTDRNQTYISIIVCLILLERIF